MDIMLIVSQVNVSHLLYIVQKMMVKVNALNVFLHFYLFKVTVLFLSQSVVSIKLMDNV